MICVTLLHIVKAECEIFNIHPHLFHEDTFSVFKLK